jgi:hypothetical protein
MARKHARNLVSVPSDALKRCSRVWALKTWLMGQHECGGEMPQIPVDALPSSCMSCALGRTNESGFPDIRLIPEPVFCWAAFRFLPEPQALDVTKGRSTWCPLYVDAGNPRALRLARCSAFDRA